MVIYIVRHPETEYNKKKIVQGHKDSKLTKNGILIANSLGQKLKNKNISKILSSDLGRCMQTSKIINKYLKLKIIKTKELREMNYGDFNGKTSELIKKNFNLKNLNIVLPNGESFNQMKKRVIKFIKSLDRTTNILIVTHEGCLRAIISYYKIKYKKIIIELK